MIHYRVTLSLGVSLLLLAGCDDRMGPERVPSAGQGVQPVRRISLDSRDESLLAELDRIAPGAAQSVRPLLENGDVAAITLPDEQAQRIVNQILANRAIRANEHQRAQQAIAARVTFAEVVMVESLPSAADAVVQYSARGRDPVIILPEDASGRALGAAIAAVYRLRKAADTLPADGGRVVIRNARMPSSWSPEMKEGTEEVLRDLRARPVRTVPGVGRGRQTRVPLLTG